MRAVLLLSLIFTSINSWALFQNIYDGYKTSKRLEQVKLGKEVIAANYDFNLAKHELSFNLGANSSNSYLQRLFSFQSQQTISQTYSMGLTKSSFKYGTLSFVHKQTAYDLSNWSSTTQSSFSSDVVYESQNQLSYAYDFLNNTNALDWDEINIQNKADKIGFDLTLEQDHLDFFNAYLNAKLKIMLDRLSREFEKRAKDRVRKISKRVTDGLSRKTDLYQANLSLLSQQESILKNETSLRESVAVIEDIIKVPITKKEYALVNWSYKPSTNFSYLTNQEEFKEISRLEYLNQVTELQLLKLDEQNAHSLSLSLSYTKNAFDEEQSVAAEEALGTSKFDEKVIGLTYTIPLGGNKKDALKRKLLFQKNQNSLKVNNRLDELNVQTKVLVENIKRYENAITLLDKKVNLAKKLVDENQRYYLRGQVSFEETLQSELNFIDARVAQVNMYALYESALAKKAFLSGSLLKFLGEYKD